MRLSLAAATCLALLGALPAAAQVMPGADCTAVKDPEAAKQCYDKLLKAAETDLADSEAKLAAKLADPKKQALYQAAAKAWADYRDRECALETADAGGQHATALSICLADKTGSRVEELSRQVDCPAGDPTCIR